MASEDRGRARVAMLVSFSSFFVFPAIPAGRTMAITIPFGIALALGALWLPRLRPSEWWPFAWMMAPVLISGCYVLLAGTALAPEIAPKAAVAMAVPFLAVVPARRLLREGHGEPFVLGAACAILVHAAIGAYQVFAFDRGEMPFAGLLRTNPAMAGVTEDIPTYVEYVKRPFGLFAEPSAMAACIGPWLVVVTSALFARRREGSRRRTATLAAAFAGGLWLVVASKSGLAAPIVAGTAVAALAAALSWRRRVATRAAALVMSGAVALAASVWLSRNAAARFELDENDSWQARLESLKLGVGSLAASAESGERFLVGVGPGQAHAAVNSTSLKYGAGGGVTAVWSVGLTYAMETGLAGILAMLVLAGTAASSIWASRARVAGAMCALVWLSGVLVGTSFVGQPALWTALAVLLSWRAVAQHGRAPARRAPEAGRAVPTPLPEIGTA